MAHVDGALDAGKAAEVEAAANADEAVAAKLEALRRTREQSREALAPLLNEPVPEALVASVQAFARRHPADPDALQGEQIEEDLPAGVVVPFAREQRLAWSRAVGGMALAASLALVVGLGAGAYIVGGWETAGNGGGIALLDQDGLTEALYEVASGDTRELPDGEGFRAIATFAVEGGTLCREFEVDAAGQATVVAVACHHEQSWRTRFMVGTAGNGEGYAPATSLEVVQSYLSGVGAGDPLAAPEEAEALAALR